MIKPAHWAGFFILKKIASFLFIAEQKLNFFIVSLHFLFQGGDADYATYVSITTKT
ncbi:MAG: hypothetical protein ACJASL_003038 [Paraglaciecola sp.]